MVRRNVGGEAFTPRADCSACGTRGRFGTLGGAARPTAELRYHGVLGPAAEDRDKVVPKSSPVEYGCAKDSSELREMDPSPIHRLNRLPWAALLTRGGLVDVLDCPKCKGRMKILAAITEPSSVRRILEKLAALER